MERPFNVASGSAGRTRRAPRAESPPAGAPPSVPKRADSGWLIVPSESPPASPTPSIHATRERAEPPPTAEAALRSVGAASRTSPLEPTTITTAMDLLSQQPQKPSAGRVLRLSQRHARKLPHAHRGTPGFLPPGYRAIQVVDTPRPGSGHPRLLRATACSRGTRRAEVETPADGRITPLAPHGRAKAGLRTVLRQLGPDQDLGRTRFDHGFHCSFDPYGC